VGPSSVCACDVMHHSTTCSSGSLRAVALICVLISDRVAVRARGFAPAPHARERPLKRRGLSLALLHPELAPVQGAGWLFALPREAFVPT
jgi:hypothetical protein